MCVCVCKMKALPEMENKFTWTDITFILIKYVINSNITPTFPLHQGNSSELEITTAKCNALSKQNVGIKDSHYYAHSHYYYVCSVRKSNLGFTERDRERVPSDWLEARKGILPFCPENVDSTINWRLNIWVMYNIGKYRKERVKFMSCTYGQLIKYKPEFLSFCLLPKWLDPTAASQHVIPSISSPWLTDPLIRVIWVASTSASALMICCATASTMGITMAAVEVLLSHMDKKAVLLMNPNVSLKWEGL